MKKWHARTRGKRDEAPAIDKICTSGPSLPRFVGVWGVGLRDAGTGRHMGGRVAITLTFDSSPIKGEGY